MAKNLCDRCRVSGCCLNYLGEACQRARERECPDVMYTNEDRLHDMESEELAAQLVIDVDGLSKKTLYFAAPTGDIYVRRDIAEAHVLAWLQQPYKEDET